MSDLESRFPFDESLEGREHELHGLEKLRALRDRKLAEKTYALWCNVPTVPVREPSRPPAPPPVREPVQQELAATEEAAELERRYR